MSEAVGGRDPTTEAFNALEDLFIGLRLSSAHLQRLADRSSLSGIEVSNQTDVKLAAHTLVYQGCRTRAGYENLVQQALSGLDLTDEQRRKFEGLSHNSGSEVRGAGVPVRQAILPDVPGGRRREGGQNASTAEVDAFYANIGDAIRLASTLRGKFQAELLASESIDIDDLNNLGDQLSAAWANVTTVTDAYTRSGSDSVELRRVLNSAWQIEQSLESAWDALHYLGQIGALIREGRRAGDNHGPYESDRVAADLARLREFNEARRQLRFRLHRLAEDCMRLESRIATTQRPRPAL